MEREVIERLTVTAQAPRGAIKDVFGEHALVHRCHRHKERNVTDLLPERDRPAILARIRGAWALENAELAQQRLELLASELARTWPDAAGSLREGMQDTLTLMRLKISGQLARTLSSTNPCESMIEPCSLPTRTTTATRHATPLPSDHQPVRIATEVPRRSGVRPDCWRSMIRTS